MPLLQRATKSLFGHSFLIFCSKFFSSLASLLVLLRYAKVLPVAAYGQYSNFWIQASIFYPLVCFGIHVLILTYSKEFLFRLSARLKPAYYYIYGIWVLLLSAVFALLQNHFSGIGFIIPFLFILSYSITYILEAALTVLGNYIILIAINFIYALAYMGIHEWVLRTDYSLYNLFLLLLIANAIKIGIYILSVGHSRKKISIDNNNELMPINTIRALWLHLGVYDVIQNIATWVDKFIVSLVLTATASAIYFNGSMNIPFLPVILSAAGSAVLIKLAAGNKDDERVSAITLMNQSGRMLSCIVFPLFFFLLFFSKELIALLLPKYMESYPIFLLALLVLPLRAYSFTTVLQRLHKGNIINAGAIGDILLAIALIYPLYQWLGLPGVALSFVIPSYLQAGFYLFSTARLLDVSIIKLLPFRNWIAKLIVFGLLFIGIHYIGNAYFAPKIVLFLGGGVMVVAVLLSLGIELRKQQKYNDVNYG